MDIREELGEELGTHPIFLGKRKVNTQWLLYCIVHNLTKVHRFGEGFA